MLKKILIADDDPSITELLTHMLKGKYQVTAVANGLQLIAAFKEDQYALIITDLIMPDMDGLECITRIKAEQEDIPIICLTGAFDSSTESTFLDIAKSMGATGAISKPFSTRELMDLIAKTV